MTELETARIVISEKNVLISNRTVVDPFDMEIDAEVQGDKKHNRLCQKKSQIYN
jgi:hypothetical protein